MLSAALTRALTTPAFVAADFVPTQWDSGRTEGEIRERTLDVHRGRFSAVEVS